MKNLFAITLITLITLLSSCAPSNEMRGEPGDIYHIYYVSVWERCEGSDWQVCALFKTEWGAYLLMDFYEPGPRERNVRVRMNYYELKVALEEGDRCKCELLN